MGKVSRYLAALAGVFVMAALLAPGAPAEVKHGDVIDWHEPIPNIPIPGTPKAVCAVTGEVELDHPLIIPPKPHHGEFDFVGVQIICASADLNYAGTFSVGADGASDGLAEDPDHIAAKLLALDLEGISDKPKEEGFPEDPNDDWKKLLHGETLGQGWSHSYGYGCGDGQNVDDQNVNKGDIAVRQDTALDDTPKNANGCLAMDVDGDGVDDVLGGGTSWVKFVRGWNQGAGLNLPGDGERVVAWGLLDWDDPTKKPEDDNRDCFRADLVLAGIPEPATKPTTTTTDPSPPALQISSAALVGTAVIYNVGDATDSKTGDPILDECDNQKKDTWKQPTTTPGSGGGQGGGGSRGPKNG
jgi:hypothetical protein